MGQQSSKAMRRELYECCASPAQEKPTGHHQKQPTQARQIGMLDVWGSDVDDAR